MKKIFLSNEMNISEDKVDFEKIFLEFENIFFQKYKEFESQIYDSFLKLFYKNKNIDLYFLLEDIEYKNFKYEKMLNGLDLYDYDEFIDKKIFVDLDYFERENLKDRIFSAYVIKNSEKYSMKVMLVKDFRYSNLIDKLGEICLLNDRKINYLPKFIFEKMYLIKVIELEKLFIGDLEENDDIIIDFEEYSEKIEYNKCIFWNLKEVNRLSNFSLCISEENLIYKNEFIKNENTDYLFIEEEKNIFSSLCEEKKITIYSNIDKKIWKFLEIRKDVRDDIITNKLSFNLVSDVFNYYNISQIIDKNRIFKTKYILKKISEEGSGHINFNEKNRNEIKYIYVEKIMNSNKIFDELNYLKEVIEEKYEKYNIRVILCN